MTAGQILGQAGVIILCVGCACLAILGLLVMLCGGAPTEAEMGDDFGQTYSGGGEASFYDQDADMSPEDWAAWEGDPT